MAFDKVTNEGNLLIIHLAFLNTHAAALFLNLYCRESLKFVEANYRMSPVLITFVILLGAICYGDETGRVES